MGNIVHDTTGIYQLTWTGTSITGYFGTINRKEMKKINYIICLILLVGFIACSNDKDPHAGHKEQTTKELYNCPMHPEIIREKPGNCPICGMTLVKKEANSKKVTEADLESLLKPTNEFVVSTIPVTSIQKREEQIEIEALGNIAY